MVTAKEVYEKLNTSVKRNDVNKMDDLTMKLMMVFLMDKNADKIIQTDEEAERELKVMKNKKLDMGMPIAIFHTRKKSYADDIFISIGTMVILHVLVGGSPGMLVMYLAYLIGWCRENNETEVTVSLLAEKIFPWGFLTEKNLNEAWDFQKNHEEEGSDNWLDHSKAWDSLRLEKV